MCVALDARSPTGAGQWPKVAMAIRGQASSGMRELPSSQHCRRGGRIELKPAQRMVLP